MPGQVGQVKGQARQVKFVKLVKLVLQLPDHRGQLRHGQQAEEGLPGAGGGLQEHQHTPATLIQVLIEDEGERLQRGLPTGGDLLRPGLL